LEKAFGYRPARGIKSLHTSLADSAISSQTISQFETGRWEFCDSVIAQIAAAPLVNKDGELLAAIKAVQMFADEMVKLA
jgi:hypothetical protein